MKSSDKFNLDELLRTKTFVELNSSEKAFVLELVDSQEAYSEMRKVVLRAEKSLKSEHTKAPVGLRTDLMDAFDAHHSGDTKKILTLWPSDKPWYRQSMVRIGIAAALIGLIWFVYPIETEHKQLAERREKPKEESKSDEILVESDSLVLMNKENVKSEQSMKSEETTDIEIPQSHDSDMIAEAVEVENQTLSDIQPIELLSAEADEMNFDDRELKGNSSFNYDMAESEKNQSAAIQSYSESARQAPAATRMNEQNLANRKKEITPPPFRLSERQDWMNDHYTAW